MTYHPHCHSTTVTVLALELVIRFLLNCPQNLTEPDWQYIVELLSHFHFLNNLTWAWLWDKLSPGNPNPPIPPPPKFRLKLCAFALLALPPPFRSTINWNYLIDLQPQIFTQTSSTSACICICIARWKAESWWEEMKFQNRCRKVYLQNLPGKAICGFPQTNAHETDNRIKNFIASLQIILCCENKFLWHLRMSFSEENHNLTKFSTLFQLLKSLETVNLRVHANEISTNWCRHRQTGN